ARSAHRQRPRRIVGDEYGRDVARAVQPKTDAPLRRVAGQEKQGGAGQVAHAQSAQSREVNLASVRTAQVVRGGEDAPRARVVIRIRLAQLLEPARIQVDGLVEHLSRYVPEIGRAHV